MSHTHVELHGAVAVLTLDDAATRNALGPTLRDELATAVLRVRDDEAIRAVVLTGANNQFCSGGDLRNIASAGGQGGAPWRTRMHTLQIWLRELLLLDKPVITAVDGAAYGAGFGLALAGDIVVASTRARFCASFMRVGLVPDCGLFYTLPRAVGVQRAREIMLSAREVKAEEALRLGLVMEVLEPEAVLPRALALAESFTHASPMALSLVKRALSDGPDLLQALSAEADAQTLAVASPEHKQAVDDFLQKRPARFQWPNA